MKCDIVGCTTELSKMDNKPRTDGVIVQVLNTGKACMVCNNCATKLGLIK